MLKKLKTSLLTVFAFGLFLAPLAAVPAGVSAQTPPPQIDNSLCQGSTLQFPEGGNGVAQCSAVTNNSASSVNKLITNVVNIFSIVVGIVAVIMIIIGGFRYITSGGDSGNVTGAKNTILYAIIGLIIVALAQFIVKFVLSQSSTLTGGTGGA